MTEERVGDIAGAAKGDDIVNCCEAPFPVEQDLCAPRVIRLNGARTAPEEIRDSGGCLNGEGCIHRNRDSSTCLSTVA